MHWSQSLSENEDVVGAAPTGDATSEWSTIWLPINVHLILQVWQYTVHDSTPQNGQLSTKSKIGPMLDP